MSAPPNCRHFKFDENQSWMKICCPIAIALCVIVAGACASSQPATTSSIHPAPASDFNKPSQGRSSDCVELRNPHALIPLRDADGTPRGYFVCGDYPVTRLQPNKRDEKALDRAGCPKGFTEIDAREVVDSPAGKMLFHPGGGAYDSYPGGSDKWGQYGHVLISDLKNPPGAADPYDGKPVGNGLAAPVAPRGSANFGEYDIRPHGIDPDMWYKKPNGKPTGARYANYGDKGHGGMYLVWNCVQNGNPSTDEKDNHVSGGGYVRAVLHRGMRFDRCDVEPLKMVSYGLDNAQNGWVTAVYGRTFTGKQWLYGWVIESYEKWTRTPDGKIDSKHVEVLWPISRGSVPAE
jgi:hypothetical protein